MASPASTVPPERPKTVRRSAESGKRRLEGGDVAQHQHEAWADLERGVEGDEPLRPQPLGRQHDGQSAERLPDEEVEPLRQGVDEVVGKVVEVVAVRPRAVAVAPEVDERDGAVVRLGEEAGELRPVQRRGGQTVHEGGRA